MGGRFPLLFFGFFFHVFFPYKSVVCDFLFTGLIFTGFSQRSEKTVQKSTETKAYLNFCCINTLMWLVLCQIK